MYVHCRFFSCWKSWAFKTKWTLGLPFSEAICRKGHCLMRIKRKMSLLAKSITHLWGNFQDQPTHWQHFLFPDVEKSLTHNIEIGSFQDRPLWFFEWVKIERTDLEKKPRSYMVHRTSAVQDRCGCTARQLPHASQLVRKHITSQLSSIHTVCITGSTYTHCLHHT